VFFAQTRVGLNRRRFRMFKFRTMVTDAEARQAALEHMNEADGPVFKIARDPRITSIGRFMRSTSLDEVPQFWNVLRGDMSLVGPRPELPRYVALYPPALRDKVLSVRPGITDLASLEYRDEGERLARASDPEREYREVVLPAKLRLAAEYLDRATMASDLRVIARTLKAVFLA
jgi:lipopolysaccharide/colanic/teichoic acid biosynthesis glycosyltransferase